MFCDHGVTASGQLTEPGTNFFAARFSRAQAGIPQRNAGVPD
jgi:hypothetical protein